MKLSTKGRYGLRCMVDLTIHSDEEKVSLCNIAQRQGISENYLEQVFATLRKTGLVKSIKGAQGGYVLAKEPSKITVGTILRALEGELVIIDAQDERNDSRAQAMKDCIKAHVWDKINQNINKLVDSITLKDLADDCRKRNSADTLMYHI